MEKIKKDKYRDNYVKSHYISEYFIDDVNNQIIVYYMNNNVSYYPLNSKNIASLKRIMESQYYEWQDYLKYAFMHNLIKILYLNTFFKKQKYFLEHKNAFKDYSVKDLNTSKFLSKGEIQMMKNFKKYNHSFFDLSSVPSYKLSTMKKVVEQKSSKK